MPANRFPVHVRRVALAAMLVAGLTACSADSGSRAHTSGSALAQASALDDRPELFAFDGGAVGIPKGWNKVDDEGTTLATYQQPLPRYARHRFGRTY